LRRATARPWTIVATLLCLAWVNQPALAFFFPPPTLRGQDLRNEARACEKNGQWLQACIYYDELHRSKEGITEDRTSYLRCLRHYHQTRRLDDESLRQTVSKMTAAEAYSFYDKVLETIEMKYVERMDVGMLFNEGLRELHSALDKQVFKDKWIRGKSDGIEGLKNRLNGWTSDKLSSRNDLRDQLREVSRAALSLHVGIKPGVLALEFASGACSALDEYSLFLAPSQFIDAQSFLRGKFVGIGVELMVTDGNLEIARVYSRSPAADVGLVRGDRITHIKGKEVDLTKPETAAEGLRGEAGSFVDLRIVSRGQMVARDVKVERQAVVANSVEWELIPDESMVMTGRYLGYIRIYNFQESTAQEVRESIAEMQRLRPLAGLLLDLRGNPGGLFKSAVATAELFLGEETIIVTGTSPLREFEGPFPSRSMSVTSLPLIVMVDGETASAAEVLAAALKDNSRARVIGQPTFGKASIQCVIPLDKALGGLRLTVAKLASPGRSFFPGQGLVPDLPVGPDSDLKKFAISLIFAPMTQPE
jgi:carboxyl-terminal processing protease